MSDNAVVRAVARVPARLGTKLLVGSVAFVLLLVGMGALGLGVLSSSNDRVVRLGALQQRATAYRSLATQADQVRVLLGIRAGGKDLGIFANGGRARPPIGRSLVNVDQTIATAIAGLRRGLTDLGFAPPADDRTVLAQITKAASAFAPLMSRIIAFDQAGAPGKAVQLQSAQGEPLAHDLQALIGRLVISTQRQTDALIAQNGTSFADSRTLFITVGAGSVFLALLLGLALSGSVIGPIRRMAAGMDATSTGDFSGRVDISNRDELGSLAGNLNRMNAELGRLYAELETVSQHKSEFLANMSHELRTPLNAIIGFSEVLHEQMFGQLNEQQLDYVADVLEAGHHLLNLINDILDLAKVESGRMELELADVSLPDALQSGLTMHGERATKGGITLSLNLDNDDMVVEADERKLRQVVFNLLSNAVKFTPPGGSIDVSASRTDGFVEVSVADTGAGVPAADQDVIFEEFRQASTTHAAHQQGTGLGLPLSRKFIELHGGRLWLDSQQPGEGSTFRFTLPVRQPVRQPERVS